VPRNRSAISNCAAVAAVSGRPNIFFVRCKYPPIVTISNGGVPPVPWSKPRGVRSCDTLRVESLAANV
jgi:hypothetical protein